MALSSFQKPRNSSFKPFKSYLIIRDSDNKIVRASGHTSYGTASLVSDTERVCMLDQLGSVKGVILRVTSFLESQDAFFIYMVCKMLKLQVSVRFINKNIYLIKFIFYKKLDYLLVHLYFVFSFILMRRQY